jgi:hypothetical protein
LVAVNGPAHAAPDDELVLELDELVAPEVVLELAVAPLVEDALLVEVDPLDEPPPAPPTFSAAGSTHVAAARTLPARAMYRRKSMAKRQA